MNLKSIFCNHDYQYSKVNLPDGQERTKKQCINCDKSVIYCIHNYEVIVKTFLEAVVEIDSYKGGLTAFNEIKDLAVSRTEVLLKCNNCGDLHKEILKGKEVN